jgi:hypothetical protein
MHLYNNLGLPGGGPREIIHILQNDKLLDNMNIQRNNVKYFIYVYIGDHQRRIYVNQRGVVPKYINKNGVLKEKKIIKIWDKLLINRMLKEWYLKKYIDLTETWNSECLYIRNMYKLINKKFSYGDEPTKLVILDYRSWENEDWNQISDEKGIEVIRVSDLADFDVTKVPYVVWEKEDHPSALAWQIVVPKLAEKLKL